MHFHDLLQFAQIKKYMKNSHEVVLVIDLYKWDQIVHSITFTCLINVANFIFSLFDLMTGFRDLWCFSVLYFHRLALCSYKNG